MVVEEGIVLEVQKDKILVQPQRSERCEGCSPEFCFPDHAGGWVIEAKDPMGAKAGQRVRLAIRERSLVWYSFVLYGIPLLGLLLGAILGQGIGGVFGWGRSTDLLAIGLGLGLLGISFLGVKRYLQKLDRRQTFRPVVIEILEQ